MTLIGLLVIGIIAGYLARLLVPGPDRMGFVGTMLLGIVGSFVGGFLWNLLFQGGQLLRPAGLIGSVVGAIIVLLIYRSVATRSA